MTAKPLATRWTPTTPTTWDEFLSDDARGTPASSYLQVKDDRPGCCLNGVSCLWRSLVGEDDPLTGGLPQGLFHHHFLTPPWLNWKKLDFRVEAVRHFCVLDIRQQSQRCDFVVQPIVILASFQWGLSQSPSGSQRGCCWENKSFLSFIVKARHLSQRKFHHIPSSTGSEWVYTAAGGRLWASCFRNGCRCVQTPACFHLPVK